MISVGYMGIVRPGFWITLSGVGLLRSDVGPLFDAPADMRGKAGVEPGFETDIF